MNNTKKFNSSNNLFLIRNKISKSLVSVSVHDSLLIDIHNAS